MGKAKMAKKKKMMRGGMSAKKKMMGGGMAKMAKKKMMGGGMAKMAKKKMMRGGGKVVMKAAAGSDVRASLDTSSKSAFIASALKRNPSLTKPEIISIYNAVKGMTPAKGK